MPGTDPFGVDLNSHLNSFEDGTQPAVTQSLAPIAPALVEPVSYPTVEPVQPIGAPPMAEQDFPYPPAQEEQQWQQSIPPPEPIEGYSPRFVSQPFLDEAGSVAGAYVIDGAPDTASGTPAVHEAYVSSGVDSATGEQTFSQVYPFEGRDKGDVVERLSPALWNPNGSTRQKFPEVAIDYLWKGWGANHPFTIQAIQAMGGVVAWSQGRRAPLAPAVGMWEWTAQMQAADTSFWTPKPEKVTFGNRLYPTPDFTTPGRMAFNPLGGRPGGEVVLDFLKGLYESGSYESSPYILLPYLSGGMHTTMAGYEFTQEKFQGEHEELERGGVAEAVDYAISIFDDLYGKDTSFQSYRTDGDSVLSELNLHIRAKHAWERFYREGGGEQPVDVDMISKDPRLQRAAVIRVVSQGPGGAQAENAAAKLFEADLSPRARLILELAKSQGQYPAARKKLFDTVGAQVDHLVKSLGEILRSDSRAVNKLYGKDIRLILDMRKMLDPTRSKYYKGVDGDHAESGGVVAIIHQLNRIKKTLRTGQLQLGLKEDIKHPGFWKVDALLTRWPIANYSRKEWGLIYKGVPEVNRHGLYLGRAAKPGFGGEHQFGFPPIYVEPGTPAMKNPGERAANLLSLVDPPIGTNAWAKKTGYLKSKRPGPYKEFKRAKKAWMPEIQEAAGWEPGTGDAQYMSHVMYGYSLDLNGLFPYRKPRSADHSSISIGERLSPNPIVHKGLASAWRTVISPEEQKAILLQAKDSKIPPHVLAGWPLWHGQDAKAMAVRRTRILVDPDGKPLLNDKGKKIELSIEEYDRRYPDYSAVHGVDKETGKPTVAREYKDRPPYKEVEHRRGMHRHMITGDWVPMPDSDEVDRFMGSSLMLPVGVAKALYEEVGLNYVLGQGGQRFLATDPGPDVYPAGQLQTGTWFTFGKSMVEVPWGIANDLRRKFMYGMVDMWPDWVGDGVKESIKQFVWDQDWTTGEILRGRRDPGIEYFRWATHMFGGDKPSDDWMERSYETIPEQLLYLAAHRVIIPLEVGRHMLMMTDPAYGPNEVAQSLADTANVLVATGPLVAYGAVRGLIGQPETMQKVAEEVGILPTLFVGYGMGKKLKGAVKSYVGAVNKVLVSGELLAEAIANGTVPEGYQPTPYVPRGQFFRPGGRAPLEVADLPSLRVGDLRRMGEPDAIAEVVFQQGSTKAVHRTLSALLEARHVLVSELANFSSGVPDVKVDTANRPYVFNQRHGVRMYLDQMKPVFPKGNEPLRLMWTDPKSGIQWTVMRMSKDSNMFVNWFGRGVEGWKNAENFKKEWSARQKHVNDGIKRHTEGIELLQQRLFGEKGDMELIPSPLYGKGRRIAAKFYSDFLPHLLGSLALGPQGLPLMAPIEFASLVMRKFTTGAPSAYRVKIPGTGKAITIPGALHAWSKAMFLYRDQVIPEALSNILFESNRTTNKGTAASWDAVRALPDALKPTVFDAMTMEAQSYSWNVVVFDGWRSGLEQLSRLSAGELAKYRESNHRNLSSGPKELKARVESDLPGLIAQRDGERIPLPAFWQPYVTAWEAKNGPMGSDKNLRRIRAPEFYRELFYTDLPSVGEINQALQALGEQLYRKGSRREHYEGERKKKFRLTPKQETTVRETYPHVTGREKVTYDAKGKPIKIDVPKPDIEVMPALDPSRIKTYSDSLSPGKIGVRTSSEYTGPVVPVVHDAVSGYRYNPLHKRYEVDSNFRTVASEFSPLLLRHVEQVVDFLNRDVSARPLADRFQMVHDGVVAEGLADNPANLTNYAMPQSYDRTVQLRNRILELTRDLKEGRIDTKEYFALLRSERNGAAQDIAAHAKAAGQMMPNWDKRMGIPKEISKIERGLITDPVSFDRMMVADLASLENLVNRHKAFRQVMKQFPGVWRETSFFPDAKSARAAGYEIMPDMKYPGTTINVFGGLAGKYVRGDIQRIWVWEHKFNEYARKLLPKTVVWWKRLRTVYNLPVAFRNYVTQWLYHGPMYGVNPMTKEGQHYLGLARQAMANPHSPMGKLLLESQTLSGDFSRTDLMVNARVSFYDIIYGKNFSDTRRIFTNMHTFPYHLMSRISKRNKGALALHAVMSDLPNAIYGFNDQLYRAAKFFKSYMPDHHRGGKTRTDMFQASLDGREISQNYAHAPMAVNFLSSPYPSRLSTAHFLSPVGVVTPFMRYGVQAARGLKRNLDNPVQAVTIAAMMNTWDYLTALSVSQAGVSEDEWRAIRSNSPMSWRLRYMATPWTIKAKFGASGAPEDVWWTGVNVGWLQPFTLKSFLGQRGDEDDVGLASLLLEAATGFTFDPQDNWMPGQISRALQWLTEKSPRTRRELSKRYFDGDEITLGRVLLHIGKEQAVPPTITRVMDVWGENIPGMAKWAKTAGMTLEPQGMQRSALVDVRHNFNKMHVAKEDADDETAKQFGLPRLPAYSIMDEKSHEPMFEGSPHTWGEVAASRRLRSQQHIAEALKGYYADMEGLSNTITAGQTREPGPEMMYYIDAFDKLKPLADAGWIVKSDDATDAEPGLYLTSARLAVGGFLAYLREWVGKAGFEDILREIDPKFQTEEVYFGGRIEVEEP